MKKIAVIGSTGSIGQQTLNVCRNNPDKFRVVSISAGKNAGLFLRQVEEFKPKVATLATEINNLYQAPKGIEMYFGEDAYKKAIIDEADIVVIALVGFIGIDAVLTAIEKGKTIALANKESLYVGGEIVIKKAKEKGVKILPVDSEHSAIWQALNFNFNKPFRRIILTASGGAFRDFDEKQMSSVKAKDALKHPTWQMGEKITIDCATLVNKAFEVVEAKWLYSAPFEKIDVIIHRESIIHSIVEFEDCSSIAQMSYPSMELPIQIALSYPKRYVSNIKPISLGEIGKLSFSELNEKKYPCFRLVVESAKKGGLYPAVVNGANEEAVKMFLTDKIKYSDIYGAIDGALQAYSGNGACNYEGIIEANNFAQRFVKERYGE